MLYFVEYQLGLNEKVRVIEFILVMHHEQPGGIVCGGFGHDLAGCDRVEPVFEVIRPEIGLVEFKINDYGKFVEGEQVFRFSVEFFLEVNNIIAGEVGTGAFAEEDIPSAVKDDNIPEAVLFEILGHEIPDGSFGRAEFSELLCQSSFIQFEILFKWPFAACFHVDHFLYPAEGMAELIGFGGHGYDIFWYRFQKRAMRFR